MILITAARHNREVRSMKPQTQFGMTFVLAVLLFVATVQAQSQDPRAWIQNGDVAWNGGNTNAALQNYNYAYKLAEQRWDWSSALTLTQRYLALGQETAAMNVYRYAVFSAWNWAIDPNTLQLRANAQQVTAGEQGLSTAVNQWNTALKNMRMSDATRQWLQQAATQAYQSYQLLQQKKTGITSPPVNTLPPSVGGTAGTNWGTNAKSSVLQVGQRYSCNCPGNGSFGSVWGTDIYTDDSSICTAAAHAGLITREAGGTVILEIRTGQQSYVGSSRYGVGTTSYGQWGRSFVFIRR